ncbi:MAG: hypothetical protein ACYTAN_15840 [Planctomycetota bacterium]
MRKENRIKHVKALGTLLLVLGGFLMFASNKFGPNPIVQAMFYPGLFLIGVVAGMGVAQALLRKEQHKGDKETCDEVE